MSSQPHQRLGNPTHSAYPEPAHPELVLPRLAILILSPPIIALLIHALLALTLSILSPPKPAYLKLEPALPESAHAKPAHPECAQPNDPTPSASSGHNLPSSVDIPGVRQVSKTCMTPVWGRTSRRTTIEMLPEDILLNIFDFYRLDATQLSRGRPWRWHRLAHVCRKWRYVISISPRRLDLRILCKYGAHIESILGFWPTIPLVIKFDATRKSKPMPRNIPVALRCSDRICDINLRMTSSMTGSIVELIQKPCPTLEKIRLTVKDAMGPSNIPIHDAFLGGSVPHLREIELDGIPLPFSAIRRVLLSTNKLTELHLSNIPNVVYFSPVDLVTALSTLHQLKQLAIGFHSPTSRPAPSMTRRPLRRTTLPSLKVLDFHGASEYLEEFVAQIHLPAVCKITIKLFNQIFFEIPQFSQFIPHQNPNVLGSPTLVLVTHAADSVSVFLIQNENSSSDEYCYLGASCRRLDWQLSFVTQILSQLSPLLSSVAKLTFITHLEMPTGKEDVDPNQWLELFRLFTQVREIHVFEQLVPNIVQALVVEAMDIGVLPELTSLSLNGYRKSPSAAQAAEEFVATRSVSGRTVSLSG